MASRTRYALNGDVSLAYEVRGEGERDILVTSGWVGSFASVRGYPPMERWHERLGRLGRVIMWDKRGTGLSERLPEDRVPTFEERMDDMRVVLDAAESERAVALGLSEGGALSALFAASHPDRVEALALVGAFARTLWAEDYEWAATAELSERFNEAVRDSWGDSAWLLKLWAPSVADDPFAQEHWNLMTTGGATPRTALAWLRLTQDLDIRDVLPAIRVPTLVIHREGDRIINVGHGRYLGEHIPGARYVELPREDHLWWVDGDDILDEIESFVIGAPAHREPDRVLATVLFTDIVDSTRRAADLGDRRWRDLLETHDRLVRERLARFRGDEVKSLGDGFLASFDGPGRAIAAACSIRDALGQLGLEVRSGLHTGECERLDGDLGGLAVNIGARVGALARPGEVLVSSTVKDLVAGSGVAFAERGEHELRGVPGRWRLFAVGSAAA